jgi:hypothetical protein
MTESVLMKTGMMILIEKLGYVEAERFVSVLLREPFDYTQWRADNLFVDMFGRRDQCRSKKGWAVIPHARWWSRRDYIAFVL